MSTYLNGVDPDAFYEEKFEGDPARYCRIEAPTYAKEKFLSHLQESVIFSVPPENDPLIYCQAERERNLVSGRSWVNVHHQANRYRDVFLNFAAVHSYADTLPRFLEGVNPGKQFFLFLYQKKNFYNLIYFIYRY